MLKITRADRQHAIFHLDTPRFELKQGLGGYSYMARAAEGIEYR
jgi:hypothetical protein